MFDLVDNALGHKDQKQLPIPNKEICKQVQLKGCFLKVLNRLLNPCFHGLFVHYCRFNYSAIGSLFI